MAIEVTIRHQKAGAWAKDYAEKRALKIVEKFPKLESVRVVIDSQRGMYETEILAQQKGQTAIGTKEHSANLRSVIDMAAARVENQLRKKRARIVSKAIRG